METRSESGARLLVVDADPSGGAVLAQSLGALLAPAPAIASVASGRAAVEELRRARFDALVVDLDSLADLAVEPAEAVSRLVRLASGGLVLVLSNAGSVSAGLATLRAGAHDFAQRPLGATAIAERLADMAMRHGRLSQIGLRADDPSLAERFPGFVGTSSQMMVVYDQIERIAASDAPAFIVGEAGTGKDICAKALHARGPRAGGSFVSIDCTAIARELLEAELFGVARGALSGAQTDRPGAAELADGGTLYLAEVDAMDLSLQAKLLRFLQSGLLSRIGEKASRPSSVRLVCGTSRNPTQLIAERRFREDLFYRLHVLPIHLPPLRQRGNDATVLAHHFLGRFAAEERKNYGGFSEDALAELARREWPGNVRELETIIRRVVVMCDGGIVTAAMLSAADFAAGRAALPIGQDTGRQPAVLPMWRQEQRIIEDAITSFGGNVTLAAQALELSPSTIYRKRQAWAEMDERRGAA